MNTFTQLGFLVSATLTMATAARAQEAAPEGTELEEVVVIGTAGGAGTDRQDASFAVTTMQADDIERIVPQSTADLFKAIPGVWAESSGGIAGANIDVRGLPGGGDAPFVTLAINGSPLYGTEMLSFFEQSSIFRIDETVASVEGLRGGPNAVFGKGEPGLTVNFNLREGSEETEGRIKYSTSDYDLQRLDGYLSGPISDDLFYMVGGYIQSSPGVRDPQFTAEEGNQFTANLTKLFETGKINVFARMTDDHGQWILPQALFTGNDEGDFAQLGNATRFRELQTDAAGDTEIFDFGNGRGWEGLVSGGSAEFDLGGGFTIRDQFTFMDGDADTYGFVPDGSPVTVGAVSAVTGQPVTFTINGETTTLADDAFVQNYRHWVVQKDLEAVINDLSLNKVFGESHDVTLGYYRASWSSDDFWLLGGAVAVQNVANGAPLDPTTTAQDIADAGGAFSDPFGLQSSGDARAEAFYLADSWSITDQLRLDLGVRYEELEIDYVLDSGPGFADGTLDQSTHLSDDETAYTAAVNFDFTDELGAFVRYTDGFLFPHFDEVRESRDTVDDVEQIEAGLKYSTGQFQLYGTAFYNETDSFSATVGGVLPPTSIRTEALGVELDGSLAIGAFVVSFIGTWQDTEITESTTPEDVGNQVLRQPDWQLRVSPSYTFEAGGFDATLYVGATWIDDRFGDNANIVLLDGYEKIDAGVMVHTGGGLFFQLHGDNVTDSDGITEGDPRNPAAPNGRPIFGRSVVFSVGYDF
jgi:iron complex outermembrane receptor protein